MSKKTKTILAAVVALLVLIAAATAVWLTLGPSGTAGDKTIAVHIVHRDGSEKDFRINTDAEFLRGALEQEALISGSESEYGLYILTVDGETADEALQEWWCITRGGEYLMTGVDATPIADGESYEITLTVGW